MTGASQIANPPGALRRGRVGAPIYLPSASLNSLKLPRNASAVNLA